MRYRLFLSVATAGMLGAGVQRALNAHWQMGVGYNLPTGAKVN